MRLEGSLLREGLELDAIRRPKLADMRKMLYPACGAAPRKVLITYIAQSQSKFVMQRCMSRCRAAGCRRRRRRSAAVLRTHCRRVGRPLAKNIAKDLELTKSVL